MVPACHTEVTVGGVGRPPPVSPHCSGHDGAINVPAWPSALPPGHYTPQLGRALVLTFPFTSSETSWVSRPRLPCLPSVPPPLLPHCSGFGGVQPVTPSINPSRIPYIVTVIAASPGGSTPLPLYRVCRPRPSGPRPPGMVGRPYPQFFSEVCSQSHPVEDPRRHVKRGLEPHRVGGG